MNAILLRHAALATLLVSAVAASPTAIAAGGGALAMDCARPAMPSLARVAAWSGTNNSTQVYGLRARVMTQFNQACRRAPGTRVELVMVAAGASPRDSLVASAAH